MKFIHIITIIAIAATGCKKKNEAEGKLEEAKEKQSLPEKVIAQEKLQERNGIKFEINQDTPYTGAAESFHSNGQKSSLMHYKDGKQHGIETAWYENGQLKTEWHWMYGDAMSAVKWKPDGTKCPLTNLRNGNGVAVWYHDNGQKKYEFNFKGGKFHGTQTSWRENGQKQSQDNYLNGKQHGIFTMWLNGRKIIETNYKDGKKHGIETMWHGFERKKSERNYTDGVEVK
jgi:antitoxin component YwqK of YwqJK toxin-antitoxin module